MIFVGIGSFVLSLLWQYLLDRKESACKPDTQKIGPLRYLSRKVLDDSRISRSLMAAGGVFALIFPLSLSQLSNQHHDDGPPLHRPRAWAQYRRGACGPAQPRLYRLLRRGCLHLRPAPCPFRPRLLGRAAHRGHPRRPLRHSPGVSHPTAPGGLSGHRHPGIRRNYPARPGKLECLFLRSQRHFQHPAPRIFRDRAQPPAG